MWAHCWTCACGGWAVQASDGQRHAALPPTAQCAGGACGGHNAPYLRAAVRAVRSMLLATSGHALQRWPVLQRELSLSANPRRQHGGGHLPARGAGREGLAAGLCQDGGGALEVGGAEASNRQQLLVVAAGA